jgi:pyruvate dehydrogenase (quinone)
VGDGINSVIEALRKRQDRIAFVSVRHEEAAAFMACALAKYTGRLESAWVLPDPALCTC